MVAFQRVKDEWNDHKAQKDAQTKARLSSIVFFLILDIFILKISHINKLLKILQQRILHILHSKILSHLSTLLLISAPKLCSEYHKETITIDTNIQTKHRLYSIYIRDPD